MAKKRVYELAKELGMTNTELVDWLKANGYEEVKSHSSSLEDEQAQAVTEKVQGGRRPKAPAPLPTTPGFVVRRRPVGAPVAAAPPPAPISEVSAEPVAPEPEASPPAPPPSATAAAEGESVAPPPAVSASSPAAPAAQAPAVPPALAASASPAAAPVEPPKPQKPTATQAVVISRPLIPIRRVTPPSHAHRQIPLAPGRKVIGEVKEFKVVSDALGRGREFIDVSKDKAGGKKRGTGRISEKQSLSKHDIMELARERAMIPIRGKKRKPTKKGKKTEITTPRASKRVVKVDETIQVGELAKAMGIKASELIRKLMSNGVMATITHPLDFETAQLLAADHQFEVQQTGFEIEDFISDEEDTEEELVLRPPVVTIMGHVDHGKTSLLDAIRKTDVAGGEAGGITQHIGAYRVLTAKGPITFLDTPGHEAFTAMRARGAKATDLVVLVVAADDGVMPQTIEAINHAKAAEVPILVAMNKIDKPGADPQKVKNALMTHGLVDEALGGETIVVPVSAKTGQGLEQLLEMIALQAEVLELSANPTKPATGVVIEAKIEKGRGPVATVLVQEGTLRAGDALVTGSHFGRIRAMVDEHGKKLDAAPPGYPVEVLGLSGVPVAGEAFNVVADEKSAKEIADHRSMKQRQLDLSKSAKSTLEDLFLKVQKGEAKELKLVIKGDVQGSVEAVADALKKLATRKVTVNVIHQAVGGISESDVMLATASGAVIVGFNVKPEAKSAEIASQEGVEIKLYSIIYEAVDDVLKAMEGLLEPLRREKVVGRAEVRNLFNVPKMGTVAGIAVVDGKISRSSQVRLIRDNVPVFTGKIGSLRRFKDDVREVLQGFECGLGIENYHDIKPGDIVEAFEVEEIRPSLN
ncbi:MAG: translation initiation factor IF-2 [Deltaproteobacteria bacterium]